MITESITPATGTCSHCQRADVPCLELGCSERDEGRRSVYSIRLELRVVVCEACLEAARVKRDVRRTRFDAPTCATELAPGITSTPGVCGGDPCIAGTRWRTSTAREYSYDSLHILRDYPSLTVAQVDAAIAYERGRSAPVALPVLPATCGECEHYVPSHVAGTGDCSIITGSNQTTFATWSRPSHCPLRKGAA